MSKGKVARKQKPPIKIDLGVRVDGVRRRVRCEGWIGPDGHRYIGFWIEEVGDERKKLPRP